VLNLRRLSYAILVIAMAVGILTFAGTAHFGTVQASTEVTGIISSDTTWTKSNSPYILTGPVAVNKGVTLTIEPGATVNLTSYYLQVNGTLFARGSGIDPIHFYSNLENRPTFIATPLINGYITLMQSSNSWNEQTGSGSIIQNALLNCNIYINNASVKIDSSSFWGIESRGGSSIISNNTITGGLGVLGGSPAILSNNISGGSGDFTVGRDYERDYDVIAVEYESSPVIVNNTITGNVAGIGFDNGDNGYYNNTYNASVIGNTIYGCDGSGIFTGGEGAVIIRDNTIYGCGAGIKIGSSVATTIENNLISNNTDGIDVAYQATIQNNTITNNFVGISTNSLSTIIYNNIQSNNKNIYLSSSINVNATFNWWGTIDTQAINQTIHDFKNDFNLGTVTFVPFLTAPNLKATPSSTSTPEIPEFPSWIILSLLGIATLVAAEIKRKAHSKPLA
jgi:parallel beta-helix repeat protein